MKKLFRKINHRNGFTLIETLVSLTIFSMAILVIGMTLANVRRDHDDSLTTEFYLYLDVIENHGYKVNPNAKEQLTMVKDGKSYHIKAMRDKLVMSTTKGGYVPLLNNVKTFEWSYHDKMLVNRVQMTNGTWLSGKSHLDEN